MVVAERELGLALEVEMGWEIGEGFEDFLGEFFPRDFSSNGKLRKMVLISTEESAEDGTRSGGCA